MRLLLIGCSGFIGKELVPLLLKGGHHLTILSRKPINNFNPILDTEKLVRLKFESTEQRSWEDKTFLDALKKVDGIINLAGEPIAEKRWSESHCQKIKNSRLQTTNNLIKTLSKIKKSPKVLINGSAIGYYGTSSNQQLTEDSPSGNDFLANLCNEWELIASKKPKGTRLVILRIGIVLESDGGALKKMLPIFKSGFGGPIGDGKQWMSWIHRSDLCQIIEKALSQTSWSGAINSVAPNPVVMSEFSQVLGKTLGRPSLLPVPGAILNLLLGDGAQVVLKGQHVQAKRLKKLGFQFKYPLLSQALSASTRKKKP